ncbi:MAG: hypothetical protein JWR19_850 [Pedosphaera sp.]|nr:hypothetical protein [Pedosphaera sp.]
MAAVLAGVVVPLKDIVPGELDLLFREAVKHDEEDDPGNADSKGDGMDALRMRLLMGEILPLREAKGLKRAVIGAKNNLSVTFEEQSECAAGGANIDGLP